MLGLHFTPGPRLKDGYDGIWKKRTPSRWPYFYDFLQGTTWCCQEEKSRFALKTWLSWQQDRRPVHVFRYLLYRETTKRTTDWEKIWISLLRIHRFGILKTERDAKSAGKVPVSISHFFYLAFFISHFFISHFYLAFFYLAFLSRIFISHLAFLSRISNVPYRLP